MNVLIGYDDMDEDLHDIKSYVQQGGTRYLFISLCKYYGITT